MCGSSCVVKALPRSKFRARAGWASGRHGGGGGNASTTEHYLLDISSIICCSKAAVSRAEVIRGLAGRAICQSMGEGVGTLLYNAMHASNIMRVAQVLLVSSERPARTLECTALFTQADRTCAKAHHTFIYPCLTSLPSFIKCCLAWWPREARKGN